ncbi:hypothetical protein LguiA_028687 [Lonicera macranthoides]
MSIPLEHDYIGLSEASSMEKRSSEKIISSSSSSSVLNEDKKKNNNALLNLKETELRLGLPGLGVSLFGKDLEDNKTNNNGYPPKNFVSGAKRGFSDALDGSGRWVLSSANGGGGGGGESESDLGKGSVLFSPRGGINGDVVNNNNNTTQQSSLNGFALKKEVISSVTTHQKNVEEKKASSANQHHSSSAPTANPICITLKEANLTVSDNRGPGTKLPYSSGSHGPLKQRAQVVGWPPIRSFRKNTMATNVSKSGDVGEGNTGSGCVYVKVSMDGAPYLRKVDLKTYSNYAHLSSALEKMFSCFTIGQCSSQGLPGREGLSASRLMDIVNCSEYVLTYEDKDRDWMLVGDVPWDMFTDSCKRLRIMKGSEAIGLAPRAMEKCKNRS